MNNNLTVPKNNEVNRKLTSVNGGKKSKMSSISSGASQIGSQHKDVHLYSNAFWTQAFKNRESP